MCTLSCLARSSSLWPHGLQPARLLGPRDSPGKTTGVGCHFLLQGILPTQGSNPRLLRLLPWHVDSLLLCHLRTLYCTLIRLQQSVNRAFTCAGKPELSQSLPYCNIPITVAVWYHTHSISKVCPCIYVSVCLSNSSWGSVFKKWRDGSTVNIIIFETPRRFCYFSWEKALVSQCRGALCFLLSLIIPAVCVWNIHRALVCLEYRKGKVCKEITI